MTEDAGHQVQETKKEKWVENELMTRNLCNKLRQEHRRDGMMLGGEQDGKNVELEGLEGAKKSDDTLKCVVQSAVILCEMWLLF